MKYLIIGNSTAAVGCVTAIREEDKKGEITVVGDENAPCYSRPLISYYLMGETSKEHLVYRDDSFFKEQKVTVLSGVTAKSIDVKGKTVTTTKGILPYDKLLVATGSRPFTPPMRNIDLVSEKCTFMTLDDAERLKAMAASEKKVLIIGAGLIGLKCAEGLYGKVKSITIIDMAPRVLPTILDEEGSKRVQDHLEQKGISFILSQSATDFDKSSATLTNGEKIAFDILVLAVGVRANVSLVKDAGGVVNRGIIIDAHCNTTLSDIYAAGDCSEMKDDGRPVAIFPNARIEGETAGYNMAGKETEMDNPVPMNATGILGLHMITAGKYEGEELKSVTESGYKRLFVKDDRLVGCILIGDTIDRAGIYTALIRNKTDLSTIDFPLIAEYPSLMAFAKKERARQLGGAW